MNIMTRIAEKLFKLEPVHCESCETLRLTLERQLDINRELTNSILELNKHKPESVMAPTQEEMKPISPSYTPWRVRQQFLEQEDRTKARILKKSTEDLEKAVGVESNGEKATG